MTLKKLTTAAAVAALAFGVAACGDDENESTAGASGGTTEMQQAAPQPVAEVSGLAGEATEVTLDAGFVEALGTLKLTPAPVGDAELSEAGVASFPITGGDVRYFEPGSMDPNVEGRIDHDGSGLSLTGGGKTVELTDFVVDPDQAMLTGKVSVDGEVAAESAPLFMLDASTMEPLQTGEGTAVLDGTELELGDDAATLLNDTFGVDALQGGLAIGVAKITLDTTA